ncbi:MAG: TSUP family transporter [Rubellimicrobium sp.]|nr:TSUP family transporter [Rubellimicrobium sp.]
MLLEVAPDLVALLVLAGFVAGFVDSIAGGGGLITVPALLLAGADPVTALATNKLQGLFGAGAAAFSYARAGQVDLRSQRAGVIAAFAAAICGSLLASSLPTDVIRIGLPVVLIGIAVFFAVKPGLDDHDRAARMRPATFMLTVAPLITFYDGLIGPGTGSFLMLGFVTLAGFGVLRATAHSKLLNFASNVGSLVAFAVVAAPWWLTGLAMGAAQVAGAALGARLAVRVGARLIKPLLVVTSGVLALRLLWDVWA